MFSNVVPEYTCPIEWKEIPVILRENTFLTADYGQCMQEDVTYENERVQKSHHVGVAL
jgi:hypothetical protein